jgi:predicted acylesterase/phospholipase RssA/CRP-like cAMP-binding protein
VTDGRGEIAGLLATSPIFGALSDDHRRTLAGTLTIRRTAGGDEVFHQGDPADSAFVILSGRLEAVREGPEGSTRIRELVGGDTVGELGLLTGGVRTATVRAVRDSVTLRLGAREFLSLIEREPSFAVGLAQALASRMAERTDVDEGTHRHPTVIAVLAESGLDHRALRDELVRAIRAFGPAEPFDPAPDADRWSADVDAIERTGAVVVLGSPTDGSDWMRFTTRQADRVVVVVESSRPEAEVAAVLHGADVAVLRPFTVRDEWSAALASERCYVLDRARLTETLGRVARRLIGRSVGLALSGGGARGMAHIGVLQELDARGITVDRIGGTSIGAFVACLHSTGFSCDEIVRICRVELAERNAFDDYTVPRVALIKGAKARKMLARVFDQTRLEDLEIETFATSADLASSELVHHRRGLVRDAVGASMSLPGYAPPFELDGRLLVDGGVLDNLPVGPLLEPWEGPVIAVDVMGRWSYGRDAVRLPRMIETLSRATVLGSRSKAQHDLARATVSIVPDTSGTKMFDFSRMSELIKAGRRAAAQALDALEGSLA